MSQSTADSSGVIFAQIQGKTVDFYNVTIVRVGFLFSFFYIGNNNAVRRRVATKTAPSQNILALQWCIQKSRKGGGVIAGATGTALPGGLGTRGMPPLKNLKSRAAFLEHSLG